MPDSHAYLSASSSSRWLHCSICPRLEAPFPNKSSIFAEEGTAAHAMAEQKLLRYLKRQNSRSPTKYDTPEMDEMTDIYRDFVAEAVEEVRKTCEYPLVLVEDRLDFSKWVPESFGTGDAVIVSPQKLWVMENWCDGKIPVALIHPASAGHGLNIQSGGHILIWFGVTWSLELYQQTNARLWRQGQKSVVTIHHILMKDTVDEDVMKALDRKEIRQDDLIGAVKARLYG